MRQGRNLPRHALATVLAACAHLVVLILIGWRIPRLAPSGARDDQIPPVEIALVRRLPEKTASAPAPRSRPPPRDRAADLPPLPQVVLPASPEPAPSTPGPPPGPGQMEAENARLRSALRTLTGCADPLSPKLTPAQRQACADNMLKQAQGAAPLDRIPSEKRAYYDAVASAYDQQSHGPPMAGHTPGPGCSVKFSGLKIVKSKPPPHSLSLGPCFVAPPQGFLTEESRVEH